jgi:hypothetical protein
MPPSGMAAGRVGGSCQLDTSFVLMGAGGGLKGFEPKKKKKKKEIRVKERASGVILKFVKL